MREIITDWGVDESHFHGLYENLQKSYGYGVGLIGNCIRLDNEFARGKIEFFPLNEKVSMLKVRVLFTESVALRRALHDQPDYYCCLISLKEGVDLHAFDAMEVTEMKSFGMSASHTILYFSADIQTLFRLSANEQTRVVIIVFKSGMFFDTIESSDKVKDLLFLGDDSVKGYASANSEIIERTTNMLDYEGSETLRFMHILGAVYQLLAAVYRQIESERELLATTTGVSEVARMVQIRNLLVSDFSATCPLLEDMAKKAQMSATKFKSLFKKLFKLPYYQYFQRSRLLAAKQNIIYGKTVSETAYEFGFNSVSNFSVAFKKMFNTSPSGIEREPGNSSLALH